MRWRRRTLARLARPRAADRQRAAREIAESGLFSVEWYEGAYDIGASSGVDPIRDYVVNGAECGRRPHPRFEPSWYLAVNEDVRASGMDPFHHYCLAGRAEGRAPSRWVADIDADALVHPLFDVDWYTRSYSDVAQVLDDPLAHFIEWGADELRDPHPMLACRWYLDRYPDVRASGRRPADHYLDTGWREGRSPHEYFDTEWYRGRYSVPDGMDALIHFIETGYPIGHVTRAQDEPCVYVPGLAGEEDWARALASRLGEHVPPSLIDWPGPVLALPPRADVQPAPDSLVRTWRPKPSGRRDRHGAARRALLVSHEATLTGAPMYLEQCGHLLAEQGFEVLVVSLRADVHTSVFSRAGLPCLRLTEACAGGDPGAIDWLLTPAGRDALSGIIRGFDPNLAIVNSLVAADACGPLVLSEVPILLQVHESFGWLGARTSPVVPLERAIDRSLMAADQVLFGSRNSMDLWRTRQPLLRGRTLRTIRIPIDAVNSPVSAVVRTNLDVAETDSLILSVATFEERKRITDIVAAFVRMNDPTTVLLLIGDPGLPGPERSAVSAAVDAGHRVVTLPPSDGLVTYYEACDALVFASQQETYPLVLQEAAHYGLPRVSSRFPGWEESVTEQSALLFDVGDVAGLTVQLRRVVRSTSLRTALATAASAEIAAAAGVWQSAFLAEVEKVMIAPRGIVVPREWL